MTLFENGRISRDLSQWVAPGLAALTMLGGVAVAYSSIQSQNAVQDERIRSLETRVVALGVDHDLLQRLDVRLANIERMLSERSRAP